MEKINIVIKGDTSDEAVSLFRYIYERFLKDEEIKRVNIYYDKTKGMPAEDSDPKEWPLQLWTKDGNIRISIYNCTAGYYGSGPSATEEILKIAGFNTDDIKDIVHTERFHKVVENDFYKI